MTEKARIYKILNHENADMIPWHIDFTIPAYNKMAAHYGDRDFGEKIGNHLALIRTGLELREVTRNFWQDEFDVIWNRTIDKDIGSPTPVLNEPVLAGYRFPDARGKERFKRYSEFIEHHRRLFVLSDLGFSLFERAWVLRGMENLLMDMILHPQFVHDLLDRILEYNIDIIRQAIQFNIDGFRFGDDWGQQKGLIMGLKCWRTFIKPRIAKMYEEVHAAGKIVMIHCCGDVKEIFSDLLEVGVDVFNPFQPEVMDVFKMKANYGDRITFYGGLSIQKTLPFETPNGVRREVKALLEKIGKGGGYILAPSHAIPGDVPVENIAALIEAVEKQ